MKARAFSALVAVCGAWASACSNGPALCGSCPGGSHCEGIRCVVDAPTDSGASSSSGSEGSSASAPSSQPSSGESGPASGDPTSLPGGASSAGGSGGFSSASSGAASMDSASSVAGSGPSSGAASSGSGTQESTLRVNGRVVPAQLDITRGSVRLRGAFVPAAPVRATVNGVTLVGGFQ